MRNIIKTVNFRLAIENLNIFDDVHMLKAVSNACIPKVVLSIGNCKRNQLMYHGFGAICYTVAELTCERLAKN